MFADDKQLYRSGKVSEIDTIRHQLCCCVTDIRDWYTCSSRRLQLNALKTELQWCGSPTNLRKFSSADLTLKVRNDVIQPVTVVRVLGAYLDIELTMKQHIRCVFSSCFFQLRRLASNPSLWRRRSHQASGYGTSEYSEYSVAVVQSADWTIAIIQ